MKRIHPLLPVFRVETDRLCALYAPGKFAVLEPADADSIEWAWRKGGGKLSGSAAEKTAAWIEARAVEAVDKRRQWLEAPFSPECLTVYLSNHCNLQCPYCYAAGKRDRRPGKSGPMPVIREEAVYSAAQRVAQNCTRNGAPFNLVLHGGGEPTLHWELVERFEKMTRQISRQCGIAWSGYIATNGVLSEKKAQWLGKHFTRVGLSCDGPPGIQDRQRPLYGGGRTSPLVEHTARAIKDAGGQFEVRSTITPQTMKCQSDIVEYLIERLGASHIRFEPAYRLFETGKETFAPDQADTFVAHFLEAQRKARSAGCDLSFSGVRMEEIHGPYCDVLRNVLHLTPDGAATACFFCVDSNEQGFSKLQTGRYNESPGLFDLYHERISAHKDRAAKIPDYCRDCINAFHCARSCPDACVVFEAERTDNAGEANEKKAIEFRCLVQKGLGAAWLLQAAENAVKKETEISGDRGGHEPLRDPLAPFLEKLPSGLNAEIILDQFKSLRNKYRVEQRRMPSPVWAERGFEDDGRRAWSRLSEIIPATNDNGPISMYIHIPFCESRCGFCDCYSITYGRRRRENEEKYVNTLLRDIEAWAGIASLSKRPVGTVHFGGGTPNSLSSNLFRDTITQCRRYLNISSVTELALESTSRLISREHLAFLRELGFTRLHIGVQTLEDTLRRRIGRHDEPKTVLKKLGMAIEDGFTTSVDIVYGLPAQTLRGLTDTLDRLIKAGVHGVSLYRLNLSNRNRRFLRKFENFKPDAVRDYVFFQAADQLLSNAGYGKNHFTHYALSQDRNLYFTHALRGEDLLALGTSADGVFGHYHYRHPGYGKYIKNGGNYTPAFEGGIMESPFEQRIRPAIAAIMCGRISKTIFQEMNAESLLDSWMESAFIDERNDKQSFSLTANGSWFVNNMIAELKRTIRLSTSVQ